MQAVTASPLASDDTGLWHWLHERVRGERTQQASAHCRRSPECTHAFLGAAAHHNPGSQTVIFPGMRSIHPHWWKPGLWGAGGREKSAGVRVVGTARAPPARPPAHACEGATQSGVVLPGRV